MSEVTYTTAELDILAQLVIGESVGFYLVPILVGFLLDGILLGVAITQYLYWWQNSRNDRLFNKVIIAIAGILILATSIYNAAWMMHLFAYGFSHWYRFFEVKWHRWNVLLDALTVATVQIFYLERLYRLANRNKWILITIIPLLTASIVGGIMASIACNFITDLTQVGKVKSYFYVWVGGTLASDLVMTTLIIYLLLKAKTGWTSTDWLMTKLVKLSIESQLPSTLSAIAFMISYGIRPVTGLNVFFQLVAPKIYVLALMALLNARSVLRKDMSPEASNEERKENAYNDNGNIVPLNQQTVAMDQLTYTEGGVTLPSLIIDIDRIPRDEEALGDLRPFDQKQKHGEKSFPIGIASAEGRSRSSTATSGDSERSQLDFAQALKVDILDYEKRRHSNRHRKS